MHKKTSGTCKHVSLYQHPVLIRLVFLSPSSSLWQCMDRDNQIIPRGHLCSRESGYIVIVSFSEDLSPCCFSVEEFRTIPMHNDEEYGKINMAAFLSRENSSKWFGCFQKSFFKGNLHAYRCMEYFKLRGWICEDMVE